MKPRHLYRLALLLVAFALVVTACSGDDGGSEASKRSTTTTRVTTTTTTTTTTTAPSVTTAGAPPVTVNCSTPDAASQTLYAAWVASNRAAAGRCASSTVVARVFENDGTGAQWSFEGCGGDDPGVPQCFFRYEGGGVTLTLQGSEASGWKATEIGFVAD